MDIGCNCFGVATAAKVPVKRYNLLVPAIFPVTEPSPDKPLSVGVEKNIHRLSEYLGRNEHRIPKASRRLARTIHGDLRRKKLGYVKVGVEAFKVLVHACQSRFARLYAQELLVRYPKKAVSFGALHRDTGSKTNGNTNDGGSHSQHETSVVGVLLANNDVRAQKMGIELLLSILRIQDSAEYIASLDNFVPMLCRLAVEESRSVSAVALQCLLEHLRLCSRISYVAKNMDAMTSAVLEIIEHEGDAAIHTYEVLKTAEGEVGELGEQAVKLALGRLSIGSRIGASPPCQAAVLIFREIGTVSHDSVESRNVVEYWIKFMDRRPARWSGGAALCVGLGILRDSCTIEHQTYALTCALVRHLASPAAAKDHDLFSALVKVVLSQATLLGPANTPAVLLLAIKTLDSTLTSTTNPTMVEDNPFSKTAREAVQALAIQTGSRAQVAAVIEAALLHPTPSTIPGALFLCEAISTVYLDIPIDTTTDDLNLTETMVLAVQALTSVSTTMTTMTTSTTTTTTATTTATKTAQTTTNTHPQTNPFVIQHTLAILRHTLEATTPGSHTSTRAARALMSFMWSIIGHPQATPSTLIALQGLFRAFTETDLTTNHGDVLAVLFVASINNQLAEASTWMTSHPPSTTPPTQPPTFCGTPDIPPSHIAAVAIVACGMWECLNKSSVGTKTTADTIQAFKPISSPTSAGTIPHTLETNNLGLAVVKQGIDDSTPFSRLQATPSTTAVSSSHTAPIVVTHTDPETILKTLGLSRLDPPCQSLGHIEFLHGPETTSPRKKSLTIVSAIQRVVSIPTDTAVDTANVDVAANNQEFNVHATPVAKARAALANPLRDGMQYESGMDALQALSCM